MCSSILPDSRLDEFALRMSGTFPFTDSDSSVACRTGVTQTHMRGPRHPYEVTVSDKVVVNVESLQKDSVAHCRQQAGILLSLGLPLRSTDATVCPRTVHAYVCA